MTIRQWLQEPSDFEVGRLLYEQYGSSAPQKRVFRTGGGTERNRANLKYELSKLVGVDEAKEPVRVKVPGLPLGEEVVLTKSGPVKVEPIKGLLSKDLPAACQNLLNDIRAKSREASRLHAQLEGMATNEERKEAANKIKKNFTEVKEAYDKIRDIEAGKLPETSDTPVINADVNSQSSLIGRRNTLRTYICQANNPKSSKRRDPNKIPVWKKELEAIEKLIK